MESTDQKEREPVARLQAFSALVTVFAASAPLGDCVRGRVVVSNLPRTELDTNLQDYFGSNWFYGGAIWKGTI